MKFKKWERDKWKHFYWGIPLGFLLQATALYFISWNDLIAIAVAFVLLLAICYGFELVSLITGKGHYEMMDALAGILGGLIGMTPVIIYTFTVL